MPERKGPQERSQRRARVTASREPLHPVVAQQGHLNDRIRTGHRPGHQRRELQPGIRALVRRHRKPFIGQSCSTPSRANVITGSSPAEDERFASSKEAETAAGIKKCRSEENTIQLRDFEVTRTLRSPLASATTSGRLRTRAPVPQTGPGGQVLISFRHTGI